MIDRIGALRRERADILRFCNALDDWQWASPSNASEWRIHDVLAHMGSSCRAIFTPAAITMLRSKDIERNNDALVDSRRLWTPNRVLREYQRWSGRLIVLGQLVSHTPLARLQLPLAELGSFRAGVMFTAAMMFDHHTHFRHDMAPALGVCPPDTDPVRMSLVLEWMFAVLSNQLRAGCPDWFAQPVVITLTGAGGGTWTVGADGEVAPLRDPAPVHIAGVAVEFPEWATKRVDWRMRDVQIDGDVEYGTTFLDWLNIV